jgi:hypothetical protein
MLLKKNSVSIFFSFFLVRGVRNVKSLTPSGHLLCWTEGEKAKKTRTIQTLFLKLKTNLRSFLIKLCHFTNNKLRLSEWKCFPKVSAFVVNLG